MPIKINTKNLHLLNNVGTIADSIKRVCLNVMDYVSLEAVIEARNNHGYTDQTGNLTSSIGSIVVSEGIINANMPDSIKNGQVGASQGRQMLEDLAQKQEGDVELHVVAGMEYASYVEHGGRVVLSGAEVLVNQILPVRLEQSGIKITKR